MRSDRPEGRADSEDTWLWLLRSAAVNRTCATPTLTATPTVIVTVTVKAQREPTVRETESPRDRESLRGGYGDGDGDGDGCTLYSTGRVTVINVVIKYNTGRGRGGLHT